MDDAVELYLELTEGGAPALSAALVTQQETGASLSELHAALVERGLLEV